MLILFLLIMAIRDCYSQPHPGNGTRGDKVFQSYCEDRGHRGWAWVNYRGGLKDFACIAQDGQYILYQEPWVPED